MQRLFLLSPANVAGLRAKQLLNPAASFALAQQFRRDGLPLGDVFTFLSALYFRGKLTYAQAFAQTSSNQRKPDADIVRIITTNRGLMNPAELITPEDLRAFGTVDIDAANAEYRRPLEKDVKTLVKKLPADGQVILLGSIATGKYRDVLLEHFGNRLVFPKEFVGRGDMSRGGMLLRAVKAGAELEYQSVAGATLHGKRAVKLGKLPRRTRV